jgi:hypothetical protein
VVEAPADTAPAAVAEPKADEKPAGA